MQIKFLNIKNFKSIRKLEIKDVENCLILVGKNNTGKTVVLDAGSWKPNIEQFLQSAHIVIASEVFVNPQGKHVFELEQCQTAQKVMTRGERSVLYENEEISVPQVKAVDTLGAGDIFHGAFCFAYFHEKKTVRDSLGFAANIASESVKYKGPREWIKQLKKRR